jgi:hypothetical protein
MNRPGGGRWYHTPDDPVYDLILANLGEETVQGMCTNTPVLRIHDCGISHVVTVMP